MSKKEPARKFRPSERQRRFVAAFKGNATEAAIAAGYKSSSARIIGSRLLAKAGIREEIDRQMSVAAKKVSVERIGIINRLWQLASLSPEVTSGSITGQVRASDALAEILGMKVQRTADLTKQFEGRSEDELDFYANNGYWPSQQPQSGATESLRPFPTERAEVS